MVLLFWIPLILGIGLGFYNRIRSYKYLSDEFTRRHPLQVYVLYYNVPKTYFTEEGLELRSKSIRQSLFGIGIQLFVHVMAFVIMTYGNIH